jgi:glycosyltransferase involved in cell wall biosynthesis
VLVASAPYAAELEGQVDVPVGELLQATDPDHFKPRAALENAHGLLFVGNNASAGGFRDREIAINLANMDLAVWGEGWENRLPPGVWRGRSIDWEDLPGAYSSAQVAVNDHHPTMRKLGFVNNRTFDAAACGAVVLSDAVLGLEDVLPVETAKSPEELRAKAQLLLEDTGATKAKGRDLRQRVLAAHTFDHRAASLLGFIEGLEDAFARAGSAKRHSHEFHTDSPLVSVLMATRNRREFLPAAIRSVLEQTYSKLELVLVNDGGDDVAVIVDGFGDPRIKYLQMPERGGKAKAINAAYVESRGELIAHLDDDDAWYPFHLESLVMALTNISGLRMAYSDAVRVEQAWNGREYQEVRRELIYHHQVDAHFLLENNYITGISVCHDRELFKDAGGMDERLSVLIDWDLWRRMALITHPYHVSKTTAEYYVRGGKDTGGKGHITNLHTADHPRYMAHRALIINKPFAIPGDDLLAKKLGAARKRSRAEFLLSRAEWRAEQGEHGKAEKALALACAVNSGEARAYREAGDYFFDRGDFAKALAYQKMALRQDDALEVDYLGAALTLYTMNRRADAANLVRAIDERFRPDQAVQLMVEEFVGRFMPDVPGSHAAARAAGMAGVAP